MVRNLRAGIDPLNVSLASRSLSNHMDLADPFADELIQACHHGDPHQRSHRDSDDQLESNGQYVLQILHGSNSFYAYQIS